MQGRPIEVTKETVPKDCQTAGEKIDYVLAGAGLATRDAAILGAPGPNGRWPTDHHAVVATLAFAPLP